MKHIKSINEEFMGIDLDKIKKKAYEYHKTKEWRSVMSSIDINTLNLVDNELRFLKKKWGSIDNLAKKILNKGETKNETIFSTILFTAFGIHAFMKLLVALKQNRSFLRFLGSLFFSDSYYNNDIKTFRDLCISIVFSFYLIVYTVCNTVYIEDYYIFGEQTNIKVSWKWDGVNNYYLKDNKDKVYHCKKIGIRRYDILYKDIKIGSIFEDDIYNLSGEKILYDIDDDKLTDTKYFETDLEIILKGKFKVNKKKLDDIKTRQSEINRLNHEIDSLKISENVDQAKKIIKDVGMEYNELQNLIIENPWTEKERKRNNKIKVFLLIKEKLEKNNNIGYLGLFATIIFKDVADKYDILNLYDRIISANDIITQLRDNNGELKPLLTFDNYEDLNDALIRLRSWRIVNEFMRQVPSTQKNLIWENRYFKEKNKSQFLTNCILKIYKNEELSKMFFKKISSIKTVETFISTLSNLTNEDEWGYDAWLKKLNGIRNVYVSWSSAKDKQIICIVATYTAIKKIAYMTNWCICRDSSYFYSYESKGYQCILYDFNYKQTDNNSVIGFTINTENRITDCNNKSDSWTMLPESFLIGDSEYHNRSRHIDPKYVKIDWGRLLMKFDRSSYKFLRKIISNKINNMSRLSSFIDYYEDDK